MTERSPRPRRYVHTSRGDGPFYFDSKLVPETPRSLTASEATAKLFRTTLITPADRRAIHLALMDDSELEALTASLGETFV